MRTITFPCSGAWRDQYYDSEIDIEVDVTDEEYAYLEAHYKTEYKDYLGRNVEVGIDYNPQTIGVYARVVYKLDTMLYEAQSKEELDYWFRAFHGLKEEDPLPDYSDADARVLVSILSRKLIGCPREFSE